MKVSVLMPVYNGAQYLQEAIDSILNQTFKDFEFIIIDDGSSDESAEIIRKNADRDKRIVFIKNEQNSGICVTLNKGLGIASGEYIVRMDCDDIALPYRIEHQVLFMDLHPNVGVAGSFIEMFNSNNPTDSHIFKFDVDYRECKADLLFSPCLAHPAAIIRASILYHYGIEYDDYYRGMEDFYFWWRVSCYSDITNIPEVLLKYRVHRNQVSQKDRNEVFLDKIKKFTKLRISKLNVLVSEEELGAINEYITKVDNFTDKKLFLLISAFSKIVRSVKKEDKKLAKAYRLVLGKAISFSYGKSSLNIYKSYPYYLLKSFLSGCMDGIWAFKCFFAFLKNKCLY